MRESPARRPEASHHDHLLNGFPGGYWKYKVVDHVLLVNVHFPPDAFFDELAGRMRDLACCYPAPQHQLAEHTGQLIQQPPEQIVVGNGVSELITALIGASDLRVAVPTPSFNPYENAALPDRLIRFPLRPPLFELDVETFADFVARSPVDAAVVISPDNPTARALPRDQLLHLVERLAACQKHLILDESFVEFATEGPAASLEPDVRNHPNLVIFKSLGKVYGVCGLRLGYMLTSDLALAEAVRRRLPDWNINTLAEYFLCNVGRYRAVFVESCAHVRRDRDHLFHALDAISDLQVVPPDANFVFCRLPEAWPDAGDLADRMLSEHSILIRHCGRKTMPEGTRYLRIASRTIAENERVVGALRAVAEAVLRERV